MKTRLIIQGKRSMPHWDDIAHPKDDVDAALIYLSELQQKEKQKRYPQHLRLIRETIEVLG